jgi:hypothetical protein
MSHASEVVVSNRRCVPLLTISLVGLLLFGEQGDIVPSTLVQTNALSIPDSSYSATSHRRGPTQVPISGGILNVPLTQTGV